MNASLSVRIMCVAMLCLIQACATLPASGPTARIIEETGRATNDFALVQLTPQNIDRFGAARVTRINRNLVTDRARPAGRTLDVDDRIVVTIWEASPDGLFATADVKQSRIEVMVDQSKSIFVPYAGRISVTNLNAEDLRAEITRKLAGRAIDPQVQVTLVDQASEYVTVVGDVGAPGQFQVPSTGLRLIEAVAKAGGTREASHETDVSIQRGKLQDTVQMDAILRHHHNNIWLRPRDVIKVTHRPRTFTAFGAVSAQNLQPLGAETVSLAEALAQSGGLNDGRADTSAVFLFRYMTQAELAGTDITLPNTQSTRGVPTVFQINFADPNALFLISTFTMRNDDLIYVANATGIELQKLTSLILSPVFGNAQAVDGLVN